MKNKKLLIRDVIFLFFGIFLVGIVLPFVNWSLKIVLQVLSTDGGLIAAYFWIREDWTRSRETIRDISKGKEEVIAVDLLSRKADSKVALLLLIIVAIFQAIAFSLKDPLESHPLRPYSFIFLGILFILFSIGNQYARTRLDRYKAKFDSSRPIVKIKRNRILNRILRIDTACRLLVLFFAASLYIVSHSVNPAYQFIEKYAASGPHKVKVAIKDLREQGRITNSHTGFYPLVRLTNYYKPEEVTKIEIGNIGVKFYGDKGFITEQYLLNDINAQNEKNLNEALATTSEWFWLGNIFFSILLIALTFF